MLPRRSGAAKQNYAAASEHFERAVELARPTFIPGWLGNLHLELAELALDRNRLDDAKVLLEQAEAHYKNTHPRHWWGEIHVGLARRLLMRAACNQEWSELARVAHREAITAGYRRDAAFASELLHGQRSNQALSTLKNRRQAQRSCSSSCRPETIRCLWKLLLKLRGGFENLSKNRTAGMARRDYFHDPGAPKPNSIRPAAAVALFDSGGNILLLRRKDNDRWTMPGGTLDFGESLTSCAIREVREETGLQIRSGV